MIPLKYNLYIEIGNVFFTQKNLKKGFLDTRHIHNSPVSQYERPRAVALASSACVDKTTKIITEFTRKDPFLRLKRVN